MPPEYGGYLLFDHGLSLLGSFNNLLGTKVENSAKDSYPALKADRVMISVK